MKWIWFGREDVYGLDRGGMDDCGEGKALFSLSTSVNEEME